MATCLFRSSLASRLQAFLEARHPDARRGVSSKKILMNLDDFFTRELLPGQPVSRKIVERYMDCIKDLATGTRINRVGVLRQFCSYLSYFDPRTCIVHSSCLPCRTRPAPHIYSRDEVQTMMKAARKLGPKGSLRPVVIGTMIGFLYATGLRIGEAINLTLRDMDFKRRVIEVREGKFGKSRYVPISSSTAKHLQTYLDRRRRAGFSVAPSAPVFVNVAGRKFGHPNFVTVFLEVVRGCGFRGPRGERGPRVHDLRHTFAVNRLLAWYRHGDNLAAKLPLLSTYLGHSTVTGTEVYLHATAQLLESTGRRFHDHFAIPPYLAKNHDKN